VQHNGRTCSHWASGFLSPADADPIEAALAAMTGQSPLDPDFFSPWKRPSKLAASISGKNLITVDISADAFAADVDQGIAERAVAQLVYTASAAAATAGLIDPTAAVQVSILVDGHTNYRAFGKVVLDKPLTRTGAFVAPVWIVDPQNNDGTAAPLTVHGQGSSSTGKLSWKLLKTASPDSSASAETYLSGDVALAAGADGRGDFTFLLNPPPGRYELQVFATDPQDPTRILGLDTKTITVG
jgi:hypothetical protein